MVIKVLTAIMKYCKISIFKNNNYLINYSMLVMWRLSIFENDIGHIFNIIKRGNIRIPTIWEN